MIQNYFSADKVGTSDLDFQEKQCKLFSVTQKKMQSISKTL